MSTSKIRFALLNKFLVDSLSKSLHICACRSCELRKSLAQKRSMPEQTSGDLSNPIRTREVLMILLLDLSVVTPYAVNKLMENGLYTLRLFKIIF
jgi:hypothetical protein